MTESEGVSVALGQVWMDDDPRSAGRRIRITEIEGNKVRGEVLSVGRNVAEGQVGHRTRWIRASRFQPGRRGYRLVENPATGTSVEG